MSGDVYVSFGVDTSELEAAAAEAKALVRELHEELGVETSVGCLWPLSFASHAYADFHLLMPLFACRVWRGNPVAKEGQRLVWAKKDEFKNYPMPPADVNLVQALWEMI